MATIEVNASLPGRFEGRSCLVSGGAQGIGRATVERLLAEGARVVVIDLAPQPEDLSHPALHWVTGDVTSQRTWSQSIAVMFDNARSMDVLVNNAGMVGSYDSVVDVSLEDWDRVVAANQTSVFYGMRAVLPHMIERGRGAIVNVSSMWGIVGASGVAAYQASKGAVTMMTRNVAATYAASGVRVNSVHPGFIDTPMTRAQDAAISDELIGKTPMARAGAAEEVAAAIAFLASDDASFITGQQLLVDGGFTSV